MSDTENAPTPEQPEAPASSDMSAFDAVLNKLADEEGIQVVDTTATRRERHTLHIGRNFFTEEYNGKQINVVWDIDAMWLVSLTAREHTAQRSGRKMLATGVDILVDGKIGHLPDGATEPVWHPLFTEPVYQPIVNSQLRVKGQQFTQMEFAHVLLELALVCKKAGMVVQVNPKKRPDSPRTTEDKLRCFAPDPVRRSAVALTDFEVVINPLFGVDEETGVERDPFVSFLAGLDDQALRFAQNRQVRNVTFLNGMTPIPGTENLVPKAADIGVFATATDNYRLYGAQPSSDDEIRALFDLYIPSGEEAVTASVPTAPTAMSIEQITGATQQQAAPAASAETPAEASTEEPSEDSDEESTGDQDGDY